MEAIVRLGALAVVGVASAVVALPHLLPVRPRPRTRPSRSCRPAPATYRCASCTCRRRRAEAEGRARRLALEADHLPKLAPYSLPPRLVLRARVHAPAGKRALERRVLHSSHLALSPSALEAVRAHRVSPGALALLLHTPRLGAPLLVFSAKGRSLEVQATRMWMTRSTLVALGKLPARARPAALRLRPVTSGSTDVRAPHGGMLGPQAVAIAKRYLGIPYVWGGSTPTGGFDCSGLMMYVYKQLGITLDHYAAWQYLEGTRIAPQNLQPGDLVFWEPKADGPGHVGMYVGDGKMINAPHTGDVVRIVSIQGRSGYVGAVRPY